MRSVLLFAFAAIAGISALSAQAAPDVVPLNFIHGLPFVDVKIGAVSSRMMFDTGGQLGLSVPKAAVTKSGSVRVLKEVYQFQDLAGNMYKVPMLAARRVSVGATRLERVAGRMHTKWGGGATTGPEAELTRAREAGSIGLEAFHGKPLMFDYKQGSLTIFEAGRAPKLDRTLALGYGGEGPFVVLHAGGRTLKFVLDTGTPVNLIDQRVLDCGANCNGQRLSELRDAHGFALMVQDVESVDLNGAPFDGILGAPFFRHYRVLFDLSGKQLHISPTAL